MRLSKQETFIHEEICNQSNFGGVAFSRKAISIRSGDSEDNQSIWVIFAELGLTQACHKKRCDRHVKQDTVRYKNI